MRLCRTFLPLVLVSLACAPSATAAPEARVIGGVKVDASTLRAHRHLASVVAIDWRYRSNAQAPLGHSCTGVLVRVRIVLTARHCVESNGWMDDPRDLVVRGGPTLKRSTGTRVAAIVPKTIPADRYMTSSSDLAVLALGGGVPGAIPVELPGSGETPIPATGLSVEGGAAIAGYGVQRDADLPTEREYGPWSPTLRTSPVPVADEATCDRLAGRPAGAPRSYCIGVPQGPADAPGTARTACFGDSGGPLFLVDPSGIRRPILVGIASRVLGATCRSGRSVYVDVASHMPWIDRVIERANLDESMRARGASIQEFSTPTGRIRMTGPPTAGSRFVAQFSFGGSWRELARFRTATHRLHLPPSRDGKLRLRVMTIDNRGVLMTASGPDGVNAATRTDTSSPTTPRRLTAFRRGVRHVLTWTAARDDDRIAAYMIEQRHPDGRWMGEYYDECSRCWTSPRAKPLLRSMHILLPGRRQFRIAAVDRAGNWSRWVESGVTTPGPNA